MRRSSISPLASLHHPHLTTLQVAYQENNFQDLVGCPLTVSILSIGNNYFSLPLNTILISLKDDVDKKKEKKTRHKRSNSLLIMMEQQ
jgi:hypothetical protein